MIAASTFYDRKKHHFAILGLALLLMLPAVLSPAMLHDSFWIDWVWSDQFTAELTRGQLYPRWLPLSDGGQGSPTFYFYPPLAFYVSGLFGLAMPTYAALMCCFCAGFIVSGYTMWAWLEDSKRRLFGALLFMAAPYHVFDFYGRGAQAEFFAISLIPLVALGLRRALNDRATLLALAYGALILTHLPLALLTSLFLILPYGIFHGGLRRLILPLAAGLGISAIYLLPALALNGYRHSEVLWTSPSFQPQSWNLLIWHDGPPPGAQKTLGAIVVALVISSVVLWVSGQRKLSYYSLGCCVLGAGITPIIWSLPLLSEVQFPFRILPLAEFAITTGFALTQLRRMLVYSGVIPGVILTGTFSIAHIHVQLYTISELKSAHPDVSENRLIRPGQLPTWPEHLGLLISILGLSLAAGTHPGFLRHLRTVLPSLPRSRNRSVE